MSHLGIVTIIGRPNVGKSTLFNRMTKSSKSIVDDQPGVTRDRIYGTVMGNGDDGTSFTVIDTGGFEHENLYYQPFSKNIVWEQTTFAIDSADVVVMVLDGKDGLHPHDEHLVRYLKQKNKNTIYVANKIDGREQKPNVFEFYQLGVEEIESCSAAHNRGVWELVELIEERLRAMEGSKSRYKYDPEAVKVALIGRPNAGKSSILNRLTGEERALVSDVAGTTRDTIDTPIVYNQTQYVLLDTAGIRRRSKVTEKIESLSVMRSLRTIEEADIILIVVTPEEALCDQDAKLVQLALSQYKPVLVLVNKWDLVPEKDSNTAKKYEEFIHARLQDSNYVPVMFISALENTRVHKIWSQVEMLASCYRQRVSTSRLNDVLTDAVRMHTPALMRATNKRVKFYFATQVKAAPPTIVVKCNVADEIQESYKRYLNNRIREQLDFGPIPLNIVYRGKSDQKDEAAPAH